MLTIHIVRFGLAYMLEGRTFGDAAGLCLYLRTQGVTYDNLMKAAEGLVRYGAYTIRQECVRAPARARSASLASCGTGEPDAAAGVGGVVGEGEAPSRSRQEGCPDKSIHRAIS